MAKNKPPKKPAAAANKGKGGKAPAKANGKKK